MYNAIIFDFFGVIYRDPFKAWLKQNNFNDLGPYIKVSDLVDAGTISEEEFYIRLANLSGKPLSSVERVFNESSTPERELIELVRRLGKSYKIGLMSNSSSEYLRPILEEHDLLNLFDEIIISAEVGFIKPGMEIFNYALSKLDAKPAQTIFIDDSVINTLKAKSYGLTPVRFTDIKDLGKSLTALKILS